LIFKNEGGEGMKKYLILDLDQLEIRDNFGRKMLFKRKSTALEVADKMCFNYKIIEIKETK